MDPDDEFCDDKDFPKYKETWKDMKVRISNFQIPSFFPGESHIGYLERICIPITGLTVFDRLGSGSVHIRNEIINMSDYFKRRLKIDKLDRIECIKKTLSEFGYVGFIYSFEKKYNSKVVSSMDLNTIFNTFKFSSINNPVEDKETLIRILVSRPPSFEMLYSLNWFLKLGLLDSFDVEYIYKERNFLGELIKFRALSEVSTTGGDMLFRELLSIELIRDKLSPFTILGL